MIKVAVLGAKGKMGARDVPGRGGRRRLSSWSPRSTEGDELSELTAAGAEVVVDFTRPDVVMDNLAWCIEHGIHAVVGTHRLRRASGSPRSARNSTPAPVPAY